MMTKINISNIIRDHISTLIDYGTNRYERSDFLLFFGVPVVLSTTLILFGAEINKDVSNVLVTVFSIFGALLFNLLIMLYGLLDKAKDWQGHLSFRLRYLREIYSNVSYAIVVAIIIVTAVFLSFVDSWWLKKILAFTIFSLSTNFIFTLLMVLKRAHNLFLTELREHTEKFSR
jgi:hypothetical protein